MKLWIVGKYLVVIKAEASHKLRQKEILFLKQNLRDVIIVTERGAVAQKGKVIEFKEKLEENFYVCHSYCIVNLDRIESMHDNTIFFDCGKQVKLGKNNYIKTKQAFNEYLKKIF